MDAMCWTVTLLAGSVAAPEGGRSLVTQPVVGRWRLGRPSPKAATMEVVDVPGQAFGKAVRVVTTERPPQSWSIQLLTELAEPIRSGDVCLLAFWMRGPQSADESGEAVALAFVQQNFAPHRKVVSHRLVAGKEWQQCFVPFKARFDLEPGKANLGFHLGFWPQTVEIGGFELVNYGPRVKVTALPGGRVSYRGREPGAPWRTQAAERIERRRKGDLTVEVVDADGKAVAGADVRVAIERHAFGFGAALMSRQLVEDSPDGERYREIVATHYNKVVLENDLKWGPWLLSKSNTHRAFRREWTDAALAWLAEHKIQVRGHWLSWGSVSSGGQERFVGRPDEHRRALFEHIREKVTAVGTRVCEWDAINHPVGWGVTYEQMHGGLDFHVDIFKLCRQVAPEGVRMWINEGQILPGGGRRGEYERIVRYLMDHGQAPDGIGFMGHFGKASLAPIPELYTTFERFAKLVPILQLTEFDVDVGDDEELQADYLRDAMTIAFSHPKVEAIVMWGFWEGRHWKPDASLYRRDWTIKPAGRAWLDLVKKAWWTDERCMTDAAGRCRVRGFKGDYKLTATVNGRAKTATATLGDDAATARIALD